MPKSTKQAMFRPRHRLSPITMELHQECTFPDNKAIICMPSSLETEPMYEKYVKDMLSQAYNLSNRRAAVG